MAKTCRHCTAASHLPSCLTHAAEPSPNAGMQYVAGAPAIILSDNFLWQAMRTRYVFSSCNYPVVCMPCLLLLVVLLRLHPLDTM